VRATPPCDPRPDAGNPGTVKDDARRQHDGNMVYAALLDHVTVMGWKRGKAFYEFRDIFGRKPNRDEQNVEPRQLSEHEHIVAQWFELRPKRKPKRT
jgi:hypothetical protein